MAKFNISVDLDWVDYEGTIDDTLRGEIVTRVCEMVTDNISDSVQKAANEKLETVLEQLDKTVCDRLNGMMEDFFNTPRDITDKWGDVKERGVTVTDKLKSACDAFMTQPLDKDGKPASNYGVKYKTRVDYIVAKSIDSDLEWAIKRAVEDVTKNLKAKIGEAIKTQMGDKLGELAGINDILAKL